MPSLEDAWTCSSIGNSDEILKYVAAVDGSLGPAALASSAATAEWEGDLNALGHAVQGYAYYYILDGSAGHRQFGLRAWGAYEPLVPLLDRALVWACFPLLRLAVRRAFGLRSTRERDTSLGVITRVLDRADAALARSEYLTGSSMSWVDMAFCALTARSSSTSACSCLGGRVRTRAAAFRPSRCAPRSSRPSGADTRRSSRRSGSRLRRGPRGVSCCGCMPRGVTSWWSERETIFSPAVRRFGSSGKLTQIVCMVCGPSDIDACSIAARQQVLRDGTPRLCNGHRT